MSISSRNYESALEDLLGEFGISRGNVVAALANRIKELQERSLKDFDSFAIFIDGYHIAGDVYIIALGIDTTGQKKALGLWEGATENHVICNVLLSD